jgi:hypothetical protein
MSPEVLCVGTTTAIGSIEQTVFDRVTEPVLRILTVEQARAVLQYRGEEADRQRIEELATKNTEGELTDEERAEYEAYVRANEFVAILQAKAKNRLSDGK